MHDYVKIKIGDNENHIYKLDRAYHAIVKKMEFKKEEFEMLKQANAGSNWRNKSYGVMESLDGKFFVLCSSSELDGIDLIFEKKINESGEEVYSLTESNKKVIFG